MLYAAIAAANSGNNTLIAAVSGKELWIYGITTVSNAAVDQLFYNGTTALTGTMSGVTEMSEWAKLDSVPLFKTSQNSAFVLNLSAAIAVNGWLAYEPRN